MKSRTTERNPILVRSGGALGWGRVLASLLPVLVLIGGSRVDAEPVRYGEAYHLQNGFADWSTYLHLCIYPANCGSDHRKAATTPGRNDYSKRFEVVSVEGRPNGSEVKVGDLVHLKSTWPSASQGPYLDVCGDAQCGSHVRYGVAGSQYRGRTQSSGTWEIVSALNQTPTGSSIQTEENIHLKSHFRGEDNYLNTCGNNTTCDPGGGYNVFTATVRSRTGCSGCWKFIGALPPPPPPPPPGLPDWRWGPQETGAGGAPWYNHPLNYPHHYEGTPDACQSQGYVWDHDSQEMVHWGSQPAPFSCFKLGDPLKRYLCKDLPSDSFCAIRVSAECNANPSQAPYAANPMYALCAMAQRAVCPQGRTCSEGRIEGGVDVDFLMDFGMFGLWIDQQERWFYVDRGTQDGDDYAFKEGGGAPNYQDRDGYLMWDPDQSRIVRKNAAKNAVTTGNWVDGDYPPQHDRIVWANGEIWTRPRYFQKQPQYHF